MVVQIVEGSIPAGAGETSDLVLRFHLYRVDPRGCGGDRRR